MSRLFPALCAAASITSISSLSFAQSPAPNLSDNKSNPILVAAASPGSDQSNLPPVTITAPGPKKPRPTRETKRPARATAARSAAPRPRELPRPETEVGSSQAGAGLGGRITGYTVDFGTPAAVRPSALPIAMRA